MEKGPVSTFSPFLLQWQSPVWVNFIPMKFSPMSPLAAWGCFHVMVDVLDHSAPKLEQNSHLNLTKDVSFQEAAVTTCEAFLLLIAQTLHHFISSLVHSLALRANTNTSGGFWGVGGRSKIGRCAVRGESN